MSPILKTQKGSILVMVLAVIAMIAVIAGIASQQVGPTQKMTKRMRMRAAMDMTESKIKSLMQQPSAYFRDNTLDPKLMHDCSKPGIKCLLDYSLLDNIDPSGQTFVIPGGLTQLSVPVGGYYPYMKDVSTWCVPKADGTWVGQPLGYTISGAKAGTFNGVILPWDATKILAKFGGDPAKAKNYLNQLKAGMNSADCGFWKSPALQEYYQALGDSYVEPRLVTFTVPPPNTITKVSSWTCDDSTPVFRGFTADGKPRCEPLYQAKCPSGYYATGLDDATLAFSCEPVDLYMGCSASSNGKYENFITDFSWKGYNGNGSGNPLTGVNCQSRVDPFSLAYQDPQFVAKPTINDPVPVTQPPIPPDPNMSDGLVAVVPAADLSGCVSWSGSEQYREVTGTSDPCTAMALNISAADISCTPSNTGSKIYRCNRCADSTQPRTWRALAVKNCAYPTAGYHALNGKGFWAQPFDPAATPAAPTMSWSKTTPGNNSPQLTATWVRSPYPYLKDQSIQYYKDATCTATSGGLIDLLSSTKESDNFTGVDGMTYTYRITSTDVDGNSTLSACSSPMTVDLTPPIAAKTLKWSPASSSTVSSVNVSWVPSTSKDLNLQRVQFYTNSTCNSAVVQSVDIPVTAPPPALQKNTLPFTAAIDGTYYFAVTSLDKAQNGAVSPCSTAMLIDTLAPNPAKALGWNATSPARSMSVIMKWTLSDATDISAQKIQMYTGSNCDAPMGALKTISNWATTSTFTSVADNTYTFKVLTVDNAQNSTLSSCSTALTIDTKAPTNSPSMGWTTASPSKFTTIIAQWTPSASSDVVKQQVEFFQGNKCLGAALSSAILPPGGSTAAYNGAKGGLYSYRLTTTDAAGNVAQQCTYTMSGMQISGTALAGMSSAQ